jgi:hypothetical protein
MTSKHCTECNYHLDGYADHETVCGACLDMATHTTVTEQLSATYRQLETTLNGLSTLDSVSSRYVWRKLDRLLGDLIADMTPTTEPADIDGAEAFSTAAERGQ